MTTQGSTSQPWLKQPGELFDRNGVPIYPGDLLRTYHFTGRRRKKHYLYHVAVYTPVGTDNLGAMFGVPVCYLEPTKQNQGGSFLMSELLVSHSEVIQGHGPHPYLSFEDRPKRKP